MRIRPATESDIDALFEVRTSVRENHQSRAELAAIGVTPERIRQMLATTARAWLAEDDTRVVAFSIADAGEATVLAVFVRPDHEGRGLGRTLMEAAERWLFSRGLEQIWLLTGSDPKLRANGFYRHLGWASAGIQPDGQIKYIKRRPAANAVG